jgi:hypothetical protein
MAKLYQFRRIIIGCVIVVVICNFLIIQAIYDDIVHDFRLAVLNKLQFSQMFLKLFERQKLHVIKFWASLLINKSETQVKRFDFQRL